MKQALFIVFAVLAAAQGDHALRVSVKGIKGGSGTVYVAAYRDSASFLADGKAFQTASGPAAEGASFTFDKLPAGTYAVSAFLDENGNGKLDKNFLGMPTEPWGVSNNPKRGMRAPHFDEASFEYDGGGKNIEIELKK